MQRNYSERLDINAICNFKNKITMIQINISLAIIYIHFCENRKIIHIKYEWSVINGETDHI
jgi:hypothetical protein